MAISIEEDERILHDTEIFCLTAVEISVNVADMIPGMK